MSDFMEPFEPWQMEYDMMTAEELLRLWRQSSVQFYNGEPRTEFLKRRISELQRENPQEYQDADRKVGWVTE